MNNGRINGSQNTNVGRSTDLFRLSDEPHRGQQAEQEQQDCLNKSQEWSRRHVASSGLGADGLHRRQFSVSHTARVIVKSLVPTRPAIHDEVDRTHWKSGTSRGILRSCGCVCRAQPRRGCSRSRRARKGGDERVAVDVRSDPRGGADRRFRNWMDDRKSDATGDAECGRRDSGAHGWVARWTRVDLRVPPNQHAVLRAGPASRGIRDWDHVLADG